MAGVPLFDADAGMALDGTFVLHDDGRLTVSAESKISEERKEDGYAVRERRYGKLSRTLQLPQGVKVS